MEKLAEALTVHFFLSSRYCQSRKKRSSLEIYFPFTVKPVISLSLPGSSAARNVPAMQETQDYVGSISVLGRYP